MAAHDIAAENFTHFLPQEIQIASAYFSEPIKLSHISPIFICLIIASLIVEGRTKGAHFFTKTIKVGDKVTSLEQLSHELHDRLGSRLVSALITIRHSNFKSNELEEEIQSCLNELRLILNNDFEPDESLLCCLEAIKKKSGIYFNLLKINLSWKISERKKIYVPHGLSLHIRRILNECLTNCLKHANAKNVNVQMRIINKLIIIQIMDDGRGMEINQNIYNSKGIQSMLHRSAIINGKLSFNRRNPSGLVVRLFLKNSSK